MEILFRVVISPILFYLATVAMVFVAREVWRYLRSIQEHSMADIMAGCLVSVEALIGIIIVLGWPGILLVLPAYTGIQVTVIGVLLVFDVIACQGRQNLLAMSKDIGLVHDRHAGL